LAKILAAEELEVNVCAAGKMSQILVLSLADISYWEQKGRIFLAAFVIVF
jgi:hypothetical protein